MPHRTLTLLILILTILCLSACVLSRRHERREDRRDYSSDLVQNATQATASGSTLVRDGGRRLES
jgi:hypothetical protein